MTVYIIFIAAALLPAYFLLRYIYRHDTIEKEPPALLAKLFFLGILSAIPACILEYFGTGILSHYVSEDSPLYSVILAFLVVAVIEEGVKFYCLKKTTWNNPNFNYRFDGIVYAVFVSLGFATIENVMYIFSYGLSVALPRALLAVPGHMGFAVFMGASYGSAGLCRAQRRFGAMRGNLFLSYFLPVLLHGFYDCCAMLNTTYSMLFFYGFVIVMYIVVIRRVKRESARDTEI